MKKAKILELDIFRGIAILAVILIHVTGFPSAKLLGSGTRWYDLYYGLNTLSFFAVPSFLFVSALVLFYRYDGEWSRKMVGLFYKKRLLYILIPYILWSTLYYSFALYIQGDLSVASFDFKTYFYKLLIGKHYTHLYFIIIIIQFYILFPFLMTLVKHVHKIKAHLIWIGILLQTLAYLFHKFVYQFTYKGSVSLMYFAVFFLGAYIGLHFTEMKAWVKRHIGPLGSAWLLSGIVYYTFFRLLKVSGVAFDGWVYELLMNVYAYLSCFVLLWLSGVIYEKTGVLGRLFTSIGVASFGIYFIHPLFLAVWRRLTASSFLGFPVSSAFVYHLSIWIGAVVAIVCSWLFVYIARKFNWSWIILGK